MDDSSGGLCELSHDQRLDLLEAMQRERARLDAAQQRLLALIAADPAPYPHLQLDQSKEWVREEVACSLRLAPCTAGAWLHEATELVERLPATLAALACGDITLLHARSLVEAIDGLDDATTAKVEQRVLATAPGQTVGNFRQAVTRAVLALDPRQAEQKHRDAVAQRRVVATPHDDGTSELWALLPGRRCRRPDGPAGPTRRPDEGPRRADG
jgi:hypothetical protein